MRKSFTRLLGLLMLVSMMSFNVVAQTLSPIDGYANVDWRLSAKNSTGVTFTLTFAQDVFPGRTFAGVIALSNDQFVQLDPIQITGTTSTNPVTGSTVVIDGKKVTITFKNNDPNGPAFKLTEGKRYFITASPDAIEYANKLYWPGLQAFPGTDDYDFFAGDYTNPVVRTTPTGFFPVDNSSAFALGGTLAVTFSEPVQRGLDASSNPIGIIAIYKADGALVEMFDLSLGAATYAGATAAPAAGMVGIVNTATNGTLYIKPASNLKELTNYYVRIGANAIIDMSVNKFNFLGINNNVTWNFTSADISAPTVTFNPEDTKERIANNTSMVLTFTDNRIWIAGEDVKNDANLTFDLYKGATKLALNDVVTNDITLSVEPTGKKPGDAGYAPVALNAADYTAKVTAQNVITITMNAAYNGATGKLISGATYIYGVKATTFNDVENNAQMPLTTVWFKADDIIAPTVTNEFLYPGGTGGALAVVPFATNVVPGDLNTTRVYFGVDATDVDAVSGIESKPTVVKYIVDVPATNYTQAQVLTSGVELASLNTTTNVYKHAAFITNDKSGNTLSSRTAYKLSYVITDAKGNSSAVRTLTVTTNDILAPTYTVVYKKLAPAATSPATAVVKDHLIEITFNETVLDATVAAFTPATFADAFELKRTNASPVATLVNGVDFNVIVVSPTVYQIVGTLLPGGSLANWMSKGEYSFKFKNAKVYDVANIAGPVTGQKNELTNAPTHNFTVKDYEGPTAVFSPVHNSIDFDNNGNIKITFSEIPYFNGAPLTNADADALIALRKGDGAGASPSSILVPRTVTVSGNEVTITPTNKPLGSEIWYRISVTTTDIKDMNGFVFNKYDNGATPIVTFQHFANFKTKDNRNPLVSFTTLQGAVDKGLSNVPNDVTVQITLDEAVNLVAGSTPISAADLNRIRPLITLQKVGGAIVEFDITASGGVGSTVITLDPIDYPTTFLFEKLASYTVSITGVEDIAKNSVAASATFTVEDSTPLTYTVSPANLATAVAKNGNLVLSFSTAVTKTPVAGSMITAGPFSVDVTNATVTGSGSTQIVIPYTGLAANSNYTLTVPAGAFTAISNSVTNAGSSTTFTTVDEQGPRLDFATNVTPVGATLLPIKGGKLTMTFDEDVLQGTGIIIIRKAEIAGSTTAAAINVQSDYVQVDAVNKKQINITVPVTLEYNKEYIIEMPSTAFRDAAGNSFQWEHSTLASGAIVMHTGDVTPPSPIPSPYVLGSAVWDFKTAADATPNYDFVSLSFLPKPGANSVALSTDLRIVFTEPVTLATTGLRRLTIYDAGPITSHAVINLASVITADDWSANGMELTIKSSYFNALLANTNYYINIDGGTFVDATGNAIVALNSGVASGWYFTTSDLTAPTATVAASSGAALTAIKLVDNIIVTFSEPISLNAASWAAAFTLSTGTFTATLAADNKTLTIDPDNNFASLTTATLTLNVGAVKDAANNNNIAATFNFTGEDKTVPSNVLATVTAYAKDKAKFQFTSNEKGTLYYRISATALTIVADVKNGATAFTYDFAAPTTKDIEISGLEEFKSYTVYTVVEDLFGNVSAISNVVVKTKDVTNPTLLTKYPVNGQDNVLYNNSLAGTTQLKIKLNFSEAIQFKVGSPAMIYIREYATNISRYEVAQGGMAIGSSVAPPAASLNDVLEITVPLGMLADRTKYYVELDYGLLADKNNQTLPGGIANLDYTSAFIGKDVWTFTTADETAPVLITATATDEPLYPKHDHLYAYQIVPVEASESFVMKFNENVQKGTGFIYIYRVGSATPQEVINVTHSNVEISGKTVTIKRFNKLQSETNYYVTVDATAITDLALVPNKYAGMIAPPAPPAAVPAPPANHWTFRTKDVTAPEVVLNPTYNSTNVVPAVINTAGSRPSFSFINPLTLAAEQVYENTGSTSVPVYTAIANGADKKAWFSINTGTIVSAIYDIATHKFEVSLTNLPTVAGYLSDTQYIITMQGSRVFDATGNAVVATEMKFNSKLTTSPKVTFKVVKQGAPIAANNTAVVDIDRETYVLVTFDRIMLKHGGADENVAMTVADLKLANYITFFNTDAATAVAYNVEVVTAGMVYKLVPTANLSSTTNYEVVWTANQGSGTEVKDNLFFPAGNVLNLVIADRTAKFKVSDYVNPLLASPLSPTVPFIPADNSTLTDLNAPLKITFNENIAVADGAYIQIRYSNGQIFQHVPLTAAMITNAVLTISHQPFVSNSGYYVIVPPNVITDASSNKNPFAGFINDVTWNFNTDDGKEPRIKLIEATAALDVTPRQNASDVPVFSALTITFDENIQTTAGRLVIYHKTGDTGFDGNVWEAIPMNDIARVKVSGSDIPKGFSTNVVTIQPDRAFVKEAVGSVGQYYVRIEKGAVVDKAAVPNQFAGINDNTTWTFTTSDNTIPALLSFTPANGSTVAVDTVLTLTFNREVLAGDGSIKVFQYSYNAQLNTVDEKLIFDIAATNTNLVTVNVDKVTVTLPGILRDNINNYYVLIDAFAFTNTAASKDPFTGISSPFTWTFITEADVTAPKLVSNVLLESVSPIKVENLKATNLTLEMRFDEPVMAGIGNIVILKKADDTVVETIPALNGVYTNDLVKRTFVATFATATLVDMTEYYVMVEANAIKDKSTASVGDVPNVTATPNYFNPSVIIAGAWSFKTGDFTPPKPISSVPANGADCVGGKDVTFTFNYNEYFGIMPNVGSAKIKKLNGTVVAEVTIDKITIGDNKLSFTVTALPDTTDLMAILPAGLITDVGFAPMLNAGDTILFRTGENTLPFAQVVSPLLATTPDTVLVIKFNEPVNVATLKGMVTINSKAVELTSLDGITYSGAITGLVSDSVTKVIIAKDAFVDESVCGPNKNAAAILTFNVADIAAPTAKYFPFTTNDYLGIEMIILFDEKVSVATGNVVVYDVKTALPVLTVAANTFTTTDNLTYKYTTSALYFGNFYVLIDAGSFVDITAAPIAVNYAGISDPTVWKLSVVDAEFVDCYTIISPLRAATSVPVNPTLSVSFCNERIAPAVRPNRYVVLSDQSTIARVEGVDIFSFIVTPAMISGNKLTIPTTGLKLNTTYSVNINLGAITDEAGNEFDGINDANEWFFTTVKAVPVPPVVTVGAVEINNETGSVAITSSKTGTVFLALETVAPNIIALQAAVANKNAVAGIVFTAGSPVTVSAAGLTPGTYKAYGVDSEGLIGVAVNMVTVIKVVVPVYPVYTIAEIQGTGASSPYANVIVTTTGVVTGKDANGFFMQDANAARSGIYVFGSATAAQVGIGTGIKITGTVTEYFDLTEIKDLIKVEFVAPVVTPAPMVIEANKMGEDYESVLVRITNLKTIVLPDSFGEWVTQNNASQKVKVDEQLFAYTPVMGHVYNITGVVNFTYSEFKLAPRNVNDIEFVTGFKALDSSIEIYPNPFENHISIKASSEVEITKAVFTNIAGQLIKEVINPSNTISTSELRNGVYFISLHTVDGIAKTERIIKR